MDPILTDQEEAVMAGLPGPFCMRKDTGQCENVGHLLQISRSRLFDACDRYLHETDRKGNIMTSMGNPLFWTVLSRCTGNMAGIVFKQVKHHSADELSCDGGQPY